MNRNGVSAAVAAFRRAVYLRHLLSAALVSRLVELAKRVLLVFHECFILFLGQANHKVLVDLFIIESTEILAEVSLCRLHFYKQS